MLPKDLMRDIHLIDITGKYMYEIKMDEGWYSEYFYLTNKSYYLIDIDHLAIIICHASGYKKTHYYNMPFLVMN